METKDTIINNYNHSITITERKNLLITGVKKIENFDNILHTLNGFLCAGVGFSLINLAMIEAPNSLNSS